MGDGDLNFKCFTVFALLCFKGRACLTHLPQNSEISRFKSAISEQLVVIFNWFHLICCSDEPRKMPPDKSPYDEMCSIGRGL